MKIEKGIFLFVLVVIALVIWNLVSSANDINVAETKLDLENRAYTINKEFIEVEQDLIKISKKYSLIFKENLTSNNEISVNMYQNGMVSSGSYDRLSYAHINGFKEIDGRVIMEFNKSVLIQNDFSEFYNKYPQIDQIFIFSDSGIARYYPSLDIKNSFVPKTDYTEFQFYKLADKEHNKPRKIVKMKQPYFDPTGKGWILSILMPSYLEDDLLGVFRVDFSLAKLKERLLKKDELIVNKDGDLIIIGDGLLDLFNIKEPNEYIYYEWIMGDVNRPKSNNMIFNNNPKIREFFNKIIENETSSFTFKFDTKFLIIIKKIKDLDFFLVKIIEI